MELSLGVLGDLMWLRLPETRPYLAKLIVDEIELAEAANRELWQLAPGDLVPDALWHPVLKPTLDRYPQDRDRLVDQLQVVFETYQDEGGRSGGVLAICTARGYRAGHSSIPPWAWMKVSVAKTSSYCWGVSWAAAELASWLRCSNRAWRLRWT